MKTNEQDSVKYFEKSTKKWISIAEQKEHMNGYESKKREGYQISQSKSGDSRNQDGDQNQKKSWV